MTTRLAQFAALLLLSAAACIAADKSSASHVVYVATLRNGFTMRFDHRELRGSSSRLFFDVSGASFVDIPSAEILDLQQEIIPAATPAAKPQPVDIPSAVEAASDRHGIDAALLYSVIRAESGFNNHAVSPKGAQGLMQLMPETADQLGVADAFDTAANIEAGTRYLRELLDRYHYDLAKALAAYNAGPARVDQYHGVPPFHETRTYVARVIRDYNKAVLSRRSADAGKQADQIASAAPSSK